MFDSLSERLSGILDRLTRRGALTEADVEAALREVRRALIEADVALDVARAFADQVKERAGGVEVIKSVTPGQVGGKIVKDQLMEPLGADAAARYAAAGRHGAARGARPAGRSRHIAGRGGADAGADRQSRAAGGAA